MFTTPLCASLRKIICLLTALLLPSAWAQELQAIPAAMNEQVVMIPIGSGFTGVQLETTLFKPPGDGPFPLVVINHGKAFGNPRFDPRARYLAASREFVKRGYLVALPMRPGFSRSTGSDISPGCNSESYGLLQGQTVQNVLAVLSKRPDVDPARILVVGQSTGGLTAMAFSTLSYPGVQGILNFTGGVKNTSCNWETALVDAFAAYGRSSQVRSLWFYGDNDSYWGADLPKRMFAAFSANSVKAHLVSYGVFAEGDAHGMFSSESGVAIWWPETEKFLTDIGLPTAVQYVIEKTPVPPGTHFADIADVQAVPILDDRRREFYRKFLDLPFPRAFAIAPHGNIGWSSKVFDPIASAVSNCERLAKETCALYAVDDAVVWPKDPSVK